MNGLSRMLVITGILLVAVGLLIAVAPRVPWLGKLPGDILIKRENMTFFMPLTTSLLLSLVLSLLFWLFRR